MSELYERFIYLAEGSVTYKIDIDKAEAFLNNDNFYKNNKREKTKFYEKLLAYKNWKNSGS
jgi:hypothetical protein